MERPKIPVTSLRPTRSTRYYIDYDWWERNAKDFNTTVEQLCAELGSPIPEDFEPNVPVDWIDPETAEVIRVKNLLYHLMTHCVENPEYITERTSIVDAVFRTLLAVGNKPLSVERIAERTGRNVSTIVRTLGGQQVYNGVRPYEG